MIPIGTLLWTTVVFTVVSAFGSTNKTLRVHFDPQDYSSSLGKAVDLFLWINGEINENATIKLKSVDGVRVNHVIVTPEQLWIYEGVSYNHTPIAVSATGLHQGRFVVKAYVEPEDIVDDRRLFVRLQVALNQPLIYVSLVIGWAYTACWSAGYYPQILLNHQRKSVVGLSFDFLHINIVGHISYSVFNSFLYWNSYIEQEYFNRHPLGLNPVISNDIGFAVHATVATGYTIVQCYIYESNGNTVSRPAKIIIGAYLVMIVISACLAAFDTIHWLDFLYVLSYVKLTTTLVKYFPQAYMNYQRQSTEGFSILNRLLDIAGGLLGIFQMMINAWNFDDWHSILGDAVKFGLGVFSILFDLLFMVQHYVLYRKPVHKDQVYVDGKPANEQTSKC